MSSRSRKPRRVAEPGAPAPAREQERTTRPASKRARNLSLSEEAIARGESYSRARGTTLSALVEQFLRGLPVASEPDDDSLDPAERQRLEIETVRANTRSPLVRDLYGLLAGHDVAEREPREAHREHLWRKYRGRT